MHVISESVLMLMTENYQNWSMFVEAIHLAKVGAFFYRAMRCKRGLCCHAVSVCLSVRPSLRPSVTFVDHVKTNKHICEFF